MSMRECLEYYILHFYTLTVGGTYHEALVCRVLDIREVTMYFFSPLLTVDEKPLAALSTCFDFPRIHCNL